MPLTSELLQSLDIVTVPFAHIVYEISLTQIFHLEVTNIFSKVLYLGLKETVWFIINVEAFKN